MELLKNACYGWRNYIGQGKLAALFLLALLYLAMVRGKRAEQVSRIGGYGAVMAVFCIFPPTAALLMCYQTRFYDYEWIWSLVPLTAVIALGGTLFLTEQWKQWKNNVCYNMFLGGLAAAMLILSGAPGGGAGERREMAQDYALAQQLLPVVLEGDGGEGVCLWAPREILEYSRALDGRVRLLYGRNMWDISLNAYSYDQYSAEMEDLYRWMERTAETGDWVHEKGGTEKEGALSGSEQMAYALEMGADRILLKDNLSEAALEGLQALAEERRLELQRTEGYYLLKKK